MKGIGKCEYDHKPTPVEKIVSKRTKKSFISSVFIVFYKIAMMELSEKIATVHAVTV